MQKVLIYIIEDNVLYISTYNIRVVVLVNNIIMKKIYLLLIMLSVSSIVQSQDSGDLEKQFYIRFGFSNPTNSYIGIDDNSFWDEVKKTGGVFELGQIFILNSIPLSDGLRLGINVDYAEFSFYFKTFGSDSGHGISRVQAIYYQ